MSFDQGNPGVLIIGRVCEDGLPSKGLVVTRTDVSAAGNVKLVDVDGETPFGVALQDTEDPLYPEATSTQYRTNQRVAIQRTGEVDCLVANDNAEITIGGAVEGAIDDNSVEGVIQGLTIRTDTIANWAADMNSLLGWAQEAYAASAGDGSTTRCRVLLDLRTG